MSSTTSQKQNVAWIKRTNFSSFRSLSSFSAKVTGTHVENAVTPPPRFLIPIQSQVPVSPPGQPTALLQMFPSTLFGA